MRSYRFPEELLKRLAAVAGKLGKSRTRVIVDALEDYFRKNHG